MPRSDLDLHCLHISHKMDARLIWVREEDQGTTWDYIYIGVGLC